MKKSNWKIKIGRILVLMTLMISFIFGYVWTGDWIVALASLGGVAMAITLFTFLHLSYRHRQWRKVEMDAIDEMTGEQFEQYLVQLFKAHGYKVKHTPLSGDYGADLILKEGNYTIVVQAKRYRSTVGLQAVQEALGAINMYGADEAWVVTNSTYTNQAKKLAEANDVYLVDRQGLRELVREVT